MFQVQCLESATKIPTQLYSKYSIGPFIKGQSTTIGIVLRFVLLSTLPVLAITGFRLTGSDNEFLTIQNVKEDVVDILLNIKQFF
jgi:DNA-directed RNA polymerase subunit alpha